LSPAWKIELELGNKDDLESIGGKRHEASLPQKGQKGFQSVLSQNDNTLPKHNTRKEIAKAAEVSTGQVGMAEHLARPRVGER